MTVKSVFCAEGLRGCHKQSLYYCHFDFRFVMPYRYTVNMYICIITRQMIIIVGANVSDMVMVIIIRRFLKCVVRGASVHVARRQLTLGAH